MLITLGVPYTLHLQSKYLDIREYTGWYREQCQDNDFLTTELKELGKDKKSRDFRGYVMLHFDLVADNIDSGVKTSSLVLDDLFKKVAERQAKVTKDETDDLARQILEEAVQTVLGFCEQVDMQ